MPRKVVDRLPEQPGIGDPPVPKAYGEPRRRADARAATTDEGPKASSDAAAGRPRERRVLLPGATTPARPMAPVREAANQRLRDTPHGTPHTGHRAAPDSPPAVPPGEPVPGPDRLRRGPARISGPRPRRPRRGRRRPPRSGRAPRTRRTPPRPLAELPRSGSDR
ncbi:hypothetical protein SRO_7532 [Streptomyces rochei]|nr:hypothetical protein SRO_0037 [Streptomyces rochei]BBC98708.1 hypothetical protein SRO_7532 [Streptomyces rochei]